MPFHISQKAKLHFYHLQALEPINTYQAAPTQHFLSLKGMFLKAHPNNGLLKRDKFSSRNETQR